MKKLIVLLVGLALITSLANAEIIYKKDDFTGKETIASDFNNVSEFNKISLLVSNESATLTFFRIDKDMHYFNNDALIKIDGEIYNLPYLTTISKVAYGHIIAAGIYSINQLGDKIKKSKTIEIRVNYATNPSTTFKLSNNILKEWKGILGKNVQP